MIYESFDRINEKVDYLNEINVFPVPDGDTGINIYITMSTVVDELKKKQDDLSIKEAANAISKGAFSGAKGNSGVILSQFFMGFAKTVEDCVSIEPKQFAEALIEGSKRAYKAVMNPREGTILSVIKDTAEAAVDKINQNADWKETVEHCYDIAQKSTLDTPNLLKDLKDAGVVDAGALGFVYLLQGWLFVIVNTFVGVKVVDLRSELENLHNRVDVSQTIDNLAHRYCTEALVSASKFTEDQAKSKMNPYGDSLLVIKNEDALKLHIHSDTPYAAIKEFSNFGHLKAAKIDDMKAQTEFTHSYT
ncbi:MAG: DAK2 domain-containing protein [Candidatus Kariarchaeaceae archaeon]|jgi:DAK2 domain fusion protein YloV